MPKAKADPDVLVLGDHPAAYFAAALLRQAPAPATVLHGTISGERQLDRLVLINPELFALDKLLAPIKRKLSLTPVHGVQFLADDPNTRSAWQAKSIVAYTASLSEIQGEMKKLAARAKVQFADAGEFAIRSLDEQGLHVTLGRREIRPRLLLLACELPSAQKKMLGLSESWEWGVLRRYSFLLLKGARALGPGSKPLLTMSLDLRSKLWWGWLIPSSDATMIAVEQPLDSIQSMPPSSLLEHWADVLVRHGELDAEAGGIDLKRAHSIDLPLAGALAQEGVANRTLLFGPAGGFYSACAEDIYPNTWSALFAAEAAKKALKEKHAQDALHVYRQRWGATLGDFLRGPQQNLRFLLPLVYRNPMMSTRLAEAILLGKSVVR